MMKRQVVSAVLACVCGATLSYADQGQRPGSAPRPRPTVGTNRDSQDAEEETHTLTGCVLAAAGSGPKVYILAETLSILQPQGTAPKPATVRDGGTRYQLLSDGVTDLAKLVNHEVSVNGSVTRPAVSSDPKKSTTRPDALAKLTIKSLRETGAPCHAGK
jgi:hypothetical protein